LSDTNASLAEHFLDYEQQHAAAALGMWVFLITEVMFFGGLFLIYAVGRMSHPLAFAAASRELDVTLGATNTAVLIVSSLTMAFAVRAAQTGRSRELVGFLAATLALGCVFLSIKGYEYYDKFLHHLVPGRGFSFPGPEAPAAQQFFSLYFAMTGLHALHIIIGAGVLIVLMIQATRGRFSPRYHNPVEMAGLYWHFVDIIWIFLFPLLYLIDIHR
jgi:cytochrome c oxidase subunit III